LRTPEQITVLHADAGSFAQKKDNRRAYLHIPLLPEGGKHGMAFILRGYRRAKTRESAFDALAGGQAWRSKPVVVSPAPCRYAFNYSPSARVESVTD